MADSDESEIDDDEFIKIFEDSDDENEFEGFGPDRNVQKDDELVGFEMILHHYLLFKNDMWSLITTQTNLYAQKRIENGHLKDKSRLQKWRPVIVDEMKVFLSLVIVMGFTHKGDILID